MKCSHTLLLALLALGCAFAPLGQRAAAGAVDPDQDARLLIQELVSPESVKALRGQKLVLTELTVSDDTDKALAAAARDFHASLQTALINSGFFQVVERAQLDRILKELKLELSDLSDPDQAQKVGKLANSDLILLGEMTKVDDRTRVSLRLVSIGTGVAIRAVERVLGRTTAGEPPTVAPSPDPGSGQGTAGEPPSEPPHAPSPAHLDFSALKLWRTLQNGSDVLCGAMSPDSSTFASAGRAGTVKLWNVRTGALRPLLKLVLPNGSYALSMSFSPDGETLVSGGSDGTIRFWDVHTGELKKSLDCRDGVTALALAHDGRMLAAANDGNSGVVLWDIRTERQRRLPDGGGVYSIAFSPDGKTLAGGVDVGAAGLVQLWDVGSGDVLWKANPLRSCGPNLYLAFSPDGKMLATVGLEAGGGASWLRLLGTETGELGPAAKFWGMVGSACLCFTPDGTALACVGDDDLMVWDMAAGAARAELKQPGDLGWANSVFFSPDGRVMVTASGDTVKIWRAR